MRFTAALVVLCLAVTHVTSHLQGLWGEGRPIHLRHGGPLNDRMWQGQNGLMGFPSSIGDFMPGWGGEFQPWSQSRGWSNQWNRDNNLFSSDIDNPWAIYQQLNSGINNGVDGSLATGPNGQLIPSGGPLVNGLNPGLNAGTPWSVLDRTSQRFPMIPNRVNPGGFVGPNMGNPVFMDSNGFNNNGFGPNNGFISNNGFGPSNGFLNNNGFGPSNGFLNNNGLPTDNGFLNNNGLLSNNGIANNQFPNAGLQQNGGALTQNGGTLSQNSGLRNGQNQWFKK